MTAHLITAHVNAHIIVAARDFLYGATVVAFINGWAGVLPRPWQRRRKR
jgi:hypothetical protein